MDVLLETSPGTGWIGRENDRVVYLPNAETVEVAHDVMEPLLVARTCDEAFAVLKEWLADGLSLPELLVIGFEPQTRAFGVGVSTVEAVAESGVSQPLRLKTGEPTAVDEGRALTLNDEDERASGMLVEGVVRAGGFRLHIHRPTSDEPHGEASLRLELANTSVELGAGLVLGRWPYRDESTAGELEPFVISDPAVSRLHAEVRPHEGSAVVVDRDSHNGTVVEAAESGRQFRLEPGVAFPVSDGDRILMGDTTMTVRGGSRPD